MAEASSLAQLTKTKLHYIHMNLNNNRESYLGKRLAVANEELQGPSSRGRSTSTMPPTVCYVERVFSGDRKVQPHPLISRRMSSTLAKESSVIVSCQSRSDNVLPSGV